MQNFILPESATSNLDIKELQQGEIQPFNDLYRALYSKLVNEASLIVDNENVITALVNHTFIKCWLHCKDLSSMAYVTAFLHITIRNHCKAYKNGQWSRSTHRDSILEKLLSTAARQGRTQQEIIHRISLLLPDQKNDVGFIFRLFYDRQLSVVEIARETGMPTTRVQENLDLAFQFLHFILSLELI